MRTRRRQSPSPGCRRGEPPRPDSAHRLPGVEHRIIGADDQSASPAGASRRYPLVDRHEPAIGLAPVRGRTVSSPSPCGGAAHDLAQQAPRRSARSDRAASYSSITLVLRGLHVRVRRLVVRRVYSRQPHSDERIGEHRDHAGADERGPTLLETSPRSEPMPTMATISGSPVAEKSARPPSDAGRALGATEVRPRRA